MHLAGKECANGIGVIAVHLGPRGEPVGGQGGEGALLNVPVIANSVVEFGGVFAGFHCLQCPQNLGDSTELGEGLFPIQTQILRQIRHALRHRQRTGIRGQIAQNQPHKGCFSATIIANESGQRCRKHRRKVHKKWRLTRVRVRNMVECNVK